MCRFHSDPEAVGKTVSPGRAAGRDAEHGAPIDSSMESRNMGRVSDPRPRMSRWDGPSAEKKSSDVLVPVNRGRCWHGHGVRGEAGIAGIGAGHPWAIRCKCSSLPRLPGPSAPATAPRWSFTAMIRLVKSPKNNTSKTTHDFIQCLSSTFCPLHSTLTN